ncbi:SDR family NAD(P)-dependent oxidoreductase [Pleomorphochaeta sp. DL1XJH-081]|uniref:SDR family NAD(P)-dependent oxidoreductase n=1 Tax=Pleomorphochaeta sp. DL1XJH-081 TaxID=3409690 RepID=UPI003BB4B3C7
MTGKRVAIVTGGTRGMGQAISLRLAKDGNIIIAVYRSHKEQAEKTLELLKKVSPESGIYKCDLNDEKAAASMVDDIAQQFGRLDILVNNAGIFDFKFLEEMDGVYLQKVLDGNFKSQFYMMRAVVPHMKKNHYGRIANASSISGNFSDVGLIAYAASKACVNMMTKISSAELAPYQITVNAYAPGIIHTDMTDAMIQERGEIQVKQISLNRFGTGEDVASLVGFLVSPEAGYVTGEIIGVDGGFFKVQNAYRAYEYVEENKNK